VDATGLVVAPGFIDLLGQSEFNVLTDNRVASKITQGITTEITGEGSGNSAAHREARRISSRKDLYDQRGVPDWVDLRGYFEILEQNRSTTNLGTFISAGGVRESVIGRDDRAATAAELREMEAQVAEAMEAGAFGLATALHYVPDSFASTDEIVALARVAARYGGTYTTHQRSEGDSIDQSLDEVFRIAREADIPVHIHHLKTAYRQNWGRMPGVLARLERARAEGIDVSADQYPYTGSSNQLDANLPPWAQEGGRDGLVGRLQDEATRTRIKTEILKASSDWDNQYLGSGGAAGILVAAVYRPELQRFEGKTLADIAQEERKDPLDVLFDLIAAPGTVPHGINFVMDESDVRAALRHPLVALCTDSAGVADDGPLAKVGSHPRAWGSATRILGKYVREEKLLSLEEAIRKMTSLPASRVGLTDRGILRPGMAADVVVFDPATVRDRATYEAPRQYSEGIRYVVINGELVLDDGTITAARPGLALRGPGYAAARGEDNP
jgi:dihydroorotase/N-acyl-D-amino-acid deacylase